MSGAVATRAELLALRRRLGQTRKGVRLLRRKREALVARLFAAARPAAAARVELAQAVRRVWRALLAALADLGRADLETLARPPRAVEVEVETHVVWGVDVAEVSSIPVLRRTVAARLLAPGSLPASAASTAAETEALAEALLAGVAREILARRLAHALARTARQTATLEQRVAPRLAGEVRRVAGLLEEREREERLRLVHLRHRRGASPG